MPFIIYDILFIYHMSYATNTIYSQYMYITSKWRYIYIYI